MLCDEAGAASARKGAAVGAEARDGVCGLAGAAATRVAERCTVRSGTVRSGAVRSARGSTVALAGFGALAVGSLGAADTSGSTIAGAATGAATEVAVEGATVVVGLVEVTGAADEVAAGGGNWIAGAASCANTGVEPSASTAEMAAVALSERVNACVMPVKMQLAARSYSANCEILDEVKPSPRRNEYYLLRSVFRNGHNCVSKAVHACSKAGGFIWRSLIFP
jgi:hypothetical protein